MTCECWERSVARSNQYGKIRMINEEVEENYEEKGDDVQLMGEIHSASDHIRKNKEGATFNGECQLFCRVVLKQDFTTAGNGMHPLNHPITHGS